LVDYPQRSRNEILDLLFRPKWGASLQHLKIEVGSDVNSTDGTEPSHARTMDEHLNPRGEYFVRGYEWWLAGEARKRNPSIVLGALAWGAPGWIGGGKYYTQDCADYHVSFIKGGERYLGLRISNLGIWNERWYDTGWIKTLRRTLDGAGLKDVEIVAADQPVNQWHIAQDMARDRELSDCIAVIGEHYPKGDSTALALMSGKRLWSSEDNCGGGTWDGARGIAQRLNQNYVRGRMTATIVWSVVTSYYSSLLAPDSGILMANTPWSGGYELSPGIWAFAHTTQFTEPGWRYMDSACVLLPGGGSVAALRSAKGGDWSAVVETGWASGPQEAGFSVAGGLKSGRLRVWRTDARAQFVRQADVVPAGGRFTMKLEPDCIYSITTTEGQRKGDPNARRPGPFPLPYRDGFELVRENRMPLYLSDQYGAFEVRERGDGKGRCITQVIRGEGIPWRPENDPVTVAGDPGMSNYTVSADCLIGGTGYVSVGGLVGPVPSWDSPPVDGFVLSLDHAGRWALKAGGLELASGTVEAKPGKWRRLGLSFLGSEAHASIDGAEVCSGFDPRYREGLFMLGCGRHGASFDDLEVKATPAGAFKTSHPNLARKAKARASSVWKEGGDYSAGRANDGDALVTRWNSAAGTGAGEWLELDFEGEVEFDRVVLRQFNDRITGYRVQARDGEGWRDLAVGARMGVRPKPEGFPLAHSLAVRLLVAAVENGPPSIYEFEVYRASSVPGR